MKNLGYVDAENVPQALETKPYGPTIKPVVDI